MAKERLYGWNGEMPEKAAGGQKAIVLRGMKAHAGEFKTGKAWTELIGGELATKQDPYRVVLYYVLILKGEGCVATNEQDIEAVTRNADVKHGVLVKTNATVHVGETIPDEPEAPAEAPTGWGKVEGGTEGEVEAAHDTLGAS